MPRATLRFGSHNVNGLASKLEGLVQLWRSLHLDIVVVLDTHVDFHHRTSIERQLLQHGWRSFWCLGYQQGGQTRAGVAILVDCQLLSTSALQLRGEAEPAATAGLVKVAC